MNVKTVISFALVLRTLPCAEKHQAMPETLSQRYSRLSCAVVQLVYPGGTGTGFFANADGDIVTAAHVALNRAFSEPGPGQIRIDIDYKPTLVLVRNGQPNIPLNLPKLDGADVNRAMNDLAVLKTGIRTSCFLTLAIPNQERVGDHVIAVGFPLSAPTGALYDGLVSARYHHLPIPVAQVNGKPLMIDYEVIRIQMPITPGASGAPVIADNDLVIGIVTEEAAIWFTDLAALIASVESRPGGFNVPAYDPAALLAKLAWIVQQFESPGAGLAVPVSYLQVQEQKAEGSGKPTASNPESRPHRNWFRVLLDHLK